MSSELPTTHYCPPYSYDHSWPCPRFVYGPTIVFNFIERGVGRGGARRQWVAGGFGATDMVVYAMVWMKCDGNECMNLERNWKVARQPGEIVFAPGLYPTPPPEAPPPPKPFLFIRRRCGWEQDRKWVEEVLVSYSHGTRGGVGVFWRWALGDGRVLALWLEGLGGLRMACCSSISLHLPTALCVVGFPCVLADCLCVCVLVCVRKFELYWNCILLKFMFVIAVLVGCAYVVVVALSLANHFVGLSSPLFLSLSLHLHLYVFVCVFHCGTQGVWVISFACLCSGFLVFASNFLTKTQHNSFFCRSLVLFRNSAK